MDLESDDTHEFMAQLLDMVSPENRSDAFELVKQITESLLLETE
jgi:hypothetical protein